MFAVNLFGERKFKLIFLTISSTNFTISFILMIYDKT